MTTAYNTYSQLELVGCVCVHACVCVWLNGPSKLQKQWGEVKDETPFRYAYIEIRRRVVVICGPMCYQLDHGGASVCVCVCVCVCKLPKFTPSLCSEMIKYDKSQPTQCHASQTL